MRWICANSAVGCRGTRGTGPHDRRIGSTLWRLVLAFTWLAGFAPPTALAAQAAAPQQQPESVRWPTGEEPLRVEFRRIFVPADRVDEVTHEHERFLPIRREEFQHLTAGYEDANAPPSVRVTRASFTARLEENRLVDGTAELEIQHAGERPAWLPLQTLGMALADLHWADGRPINSGTYHDDDRHGADTGVVVNNPGTLQFAWTAGGAALADGTEFRLTLPEAVATELTLVLPPTTRLSAEGASLRSRSRDESGGTAYRLALRGGAPVVVRTADPIATGLGGSGGLTVRHITTYSVTASATQVDSKIRVGPFAHAVRQLVIRVPTSMHAIALALGGQPLAFTEQPATDSGNEKLITVELHQPLPPGETELRVRGMTATQLDQLVTLPNFRLAQSTWLAGTVHLDLEEGLQLHDLVHEGLRPNGADERESAPESRRAFEQIAAAASLQVRVGRAPKRLAVQALTSIEIGREEILADATVDVTCENGAQSILGAELGEGWEIGSVESQPVGLVRSWSLDRDRDAENGPRSVTVVMDRPVTPLHPVRLRFRARRQRSTEDEGLSMAQLSLLRWNDTSSQSQWVEVVSGSTLQVIADGTVSAQTVAAAGLPPRLRSLVGERPDAYLLAARPETDATVFRTRPRSAEVSAEVRLDAEVTASVVRHAYRFRIQPQSGAVSRLGIVLSEPPPAAFQWRFIDRNGKELMAERISAGGASRRRPQASSRTLRWRIAQAVAGPFDLLLSFEREWEGTGELTFAAVESAGPQSGEVWLSVDPSIQLAIDNRGLEPLDAGAASEGAEVRRSFAYRYQPDRVLRRDAGPPLVVRRVGAEDVVPSAWIRTARLDSVYLPDGDISHTLAILVESNGQEELDILLPTAERILFRTGGSGWRQLARASAKEPIGIPLGNSAGMVPLEIRFSERRRPLRNFASLGPTPIDFSCPTALFERRVWVPHGYQRIQMSGTAERLLAGIFVFGNGSSTHAASISPHEWVGRAPGWGLLELDTATPAGTLDIVHVTSLRLWCLATLLLGFTGGAYLCRLGQRFSIVAAAAGLATALLLPVPYGSLASALAWGCVAGFLVQVIFVPLASQLKQRLPGGTRPQEMVATTALVLLVFCLSRDGSSAEPATRDASTPIRSVIDPIDAERRPAGDFVFIPDSLYAALLRREREARAPLGHWLIARSHVRGAVTEDGDVAPMGSQAFSIALELETFYRETEIRLPFGEGSSPVRVISIRVDGAVATSRWSDAGRALYVRIPQAGRHHLELRVLPQVQRRGASRELSLPLVPTGECYVEVAVPQGMPPLDFPESEGDVQFAPTASMYRGQVGSISELRIVWPAPAGSSNASAQADLLTWMYVQRSVAVIEQRLVVHGEGEEPLYVDVVPPAGARYVPGGRELQYASISAAANGRITLVIQPQEAESVVIPLQFIQEYPAGTTALFTPRFVIEGGVQVVDRWLAVHAAPQLTLRPEPGTSAEIVEPGAFLDRWGQAEMLPDIAFRAYPDAPSWRIGLEVRDPYIEAAESIMAIASPAGIAVRYRADVRVLDGSILLRLLDVPREVIVSAVEIVRDGAVQSVQWNETGDGRLRILFPEPIRGSFTLRVDGEVQAGEKGEVILPLLSFDAQKSDTPRVTVARTAGTALELEQSDALEPIPGDSPPTPWQSDWYLHGQYVLGANSGGASLVRGTVRAAEPPREVRTVTSLVPDIRGWTVGVHCLLRGVQQPLDRLVFVGSKEWTGPHDVEPAGRWRVEVREEALHNRIIVTPLAESSGEVRLTLRGRLATNRQDQAMIPAIRLVNPSADEGLVALPRKPAPGQPAARPTSNLIGVEDTAAGEVIGNPEEWVLYRPSADLATARISLVEQSPAAPLISFVDAVVHLSSRRQVFSEATFTLDPRGRRSCEILVPEGHRLLDIRVNGRNLSSYRLAPQRWKIQLDSSQLPQLVTVAYQSDSTVEEANGHLFVPGFVAEGRAIPVLQTAWHIVSDQPWKPEESAANGSSQISGSMLAAVRTANLVESLDEVLPALVATPMENWHRWLAYWRDRIDLAQERYVVRTRSEPYDEDAVQAAQAAQQRLARIAEALPQLPHSGDADTLAGVAPYSPRPSGAAGAYDLYLLADGSLASIRGRRPNDPGEDTPHRWLGAGLLGLIGLGLARSRCEGSADSRSSGTALPLSLLFLLAVWALVAGNLAAIIGLLAAVLLVLAWNARHTIGWRRSAADHGL